MSGRGDTPVTGALVGSLLPSGSHPELKDQAVPDASVRGRAQS